MRPVLDVKKNDSDYLYYNYCRMTRDIFVNYLDIYCTNYGRDQNLTVPLAMSVITGSMSKLQLRTVFMKVSYLERATPLAPSGRAALPDPPGD